MIIVGVIGNAINVLIFASDRSYRTTVCTFYYLIASIQSIITLSINVGIRVAFDGFSVELGRTSVASCKVRRYCAGVFSLIPLCFACLAAIDQFFATSSDVRVRNLSSIKWAHRIAIIVIISCCLYGTPYIIFANLAPNTGICIYTNTIFQVYVPLFVVLVLAITVSLILIIFGYLAYRNIQRTTALAEQGAQIQLTRMVCMQVILTVSCLTPYCVYTIYIWLTAGILQTMNPNSIEYCISTVSGLLMWMTYAVCFVRCRKKNMAHIASNEF